jgi:hypothetical protein
MVKYNVCDTHPDVEVPFRGAPCWKCGVYAKEVRRLRDERLALRLTYLFVGIPLLILGAIGAVKTWHYINKGEVHGVQNRDR